MIQIILTVGLPASGKSTWAKEECAKKKHFVRINKDDIRAMLGQPHNAEYERTVVLGMRDALVRHFIEKDQSIIIDDTNFHIKHLRTIIKIAQDYNKPISINIKYFDIDLKTCIERNAVRPNSVPEHVIRDLDSRNSGFALKRLLDEMKDMCDHFNTRDLFDTTPVVLSRQGKHQAYICDLDGTLATLGDRSPYDASQCDKDLLNEPVANILKTAHQNGIKIILLSGRDDIYLPQTENWLKKHDIQYHELFLRKAGDMRSDRVVKYEIYTSKIAPKYNVISAFEDRPQMVRMWKEIGIFCFDVYQDPNRTDF